MLACGAKSPTAIHNNLGWHTPPAPRKSRNDHEVEHVDERAMAVDASAPEATKVTVRGLPAYSKRTATREHCRHSSSGAPSLAPSSEGFLASRIISPL